MSKSVSNDALWEKLSEIEERINQYFRKWEVSIPTKEQIDISSELKANKDEIVEIFKKCIQGLGTHCDSHFKTIYKNIGLLGENTSEIYKALDCMWNEIWESEERSKTELRKNNSYLNLKLFKVKKTSLVIVGLGLLVFILTLFSMKQQNEYSLLMDEYYRQSITTDQLKVEMDSVKNANKEHTDRKKK
jgi:hypothetical protein